MINAGVIGFGYWGPNIFRNFNENPNIQVLKICDISLGRLEAVKHSYPKIELTDQVEEVVFDKNIDLIAIVTPVFSHFELAKKSLENGKHVFVEKPFTYTSDQAKQLIDLALKKNLIIMVDHTFLFTNSVLKIKELIVNNQLGNLLYYDSVRINLGLFQHDVNVIWDLAPHDIAILNYLIDDLEPLSVNAIGSQHFGTQQEDVAYLHIKFNNNFIANFHVNWLSPAKIRQTIIAGDQKMLLWNDLLSDEKIKVYDKGVDVKNKKGVYDLLVSYRSGDIWSPKLKNVEALKMETEYLVKCISNNETPLNDGVSGLKVVEILEASEKSIKNAGKEIILRN